MAASPANPPLESLSIGELQDELDVRRCIIASLQDDDQQQAYDTQQQIADAKKEIAKIVRLINKAGVQTKGFKKTPKPAPAMSPWHAFDDEAGRSGYSAHGTGNHTPTNRSTTTGASSASSHRKRPFPNYLNSHGGSDGSRTKSRLTPSPLNTAISTPSASDEYTTDSPDFIDLTGDDSDYLQNQQAALDRAAQQKRDEQLARDLQLGLREAENVPASSSTNTPNIWDRMLGRGHQSRGPRGPNSQGNSQGAVFSGSANTQNSTPNMPGAFLDDDDDMSLFDGDNASYSFDLDNLPPSHVSLPSIDLPTPNFPSSVPAYSPASGQYPGYVPGFGPANGNAGALSGYSMPGPSTALGYRPGMLNSGAYNPLQGDYSVNGYPNGANSSLSNIINQTNGIDWANSLDATGMPLNDRLREYYEDLQDDPRKTDEEIRDLLANIRPDEEIPEENRIGTPEALRYPLYPHQRLALQWMIDSENGKNRGGILADDMGLGKTVSTISLLVSRPSSDRVKTNLIVGPVALIKQWETEIKKKVKAAHKLSVILLHSKTASYEDLRKYDVVLTSYGKLGFEQKRYQKWIDDHPGADASQDPDLAKSCPLTHPKSKFYRVILDEAQCIKNVNTMQAKAASRVVATHRWCLTGTPMMNGVHELYSLIKFLRIAPYHNQKEFNKMFGSLSGKSGKSRAASEHTRTKAMNVLRVLLKAIMLRRMKTSTLDGKPLLNLPPKTEEACHVEFSADEQSFYRDLEGKSQVTFNKYLRTGTVGKNYSNILVLLLRLRQACCHPHLNLDVEYVGNSEVSQKDMEALAKTLAPDVIARLKAANEEGFNCPICLDAVIDPTIVLPCGHNSCGECFATLVAGAADNNLRAGDEGVSLKCPECRGSVNPKNVINLTAFKAVHMPDPGAVNQDDHENSSGIDDSDSDDDSSDSDSDGDDIGDDVDRNGNLKDFIVDDDEDEPVTDNMDVDDGGDLFVPQAAELSKKSKSKGKKKGKGKGKGKDKKEEVQPHMLKTLRNEAKKNKAEYKRYMKYLKKNWLPSAKVTECCRILKDIQASGDKTIVFSQFTFLLDLLEIPIKYELGLNYCRYDGGMSRQKRDAAAQDFQDTSSRTKVMLVSLKAGNAGLNLTSANHVVIMDPFWNPYIENQAVDRAHRIGQQKPVQVHRLLVKETVEDRIVALQEQKREFVDAALDEGESKNIGRLSVRDLQFLFNGRG